LNVLDGYAVGDHRAIVIKQRRLVSEFPRSPSGTAIAGWMDNRIRHTSDSRQVAFQGAVRNRGMNARAIVSLLERR
jgi:hypothetical protein